MSLPSVLKAPIQPAFYYEEGGVPVFKPTWDEFHDFNSFVSSIDSYGARAGIGRCSISFPVKCKLFSENYSPKRVA